MMYSLGACLIGFLLDLWLGDPQWLFHPIRLIGNLIHNTEKIVRNVFPKTEKGCFFAGIGLVLVVVTVVTTISYFILISCYSLNPILGIVIESIMCYFLLATKSLKTESMKVYEKLKADDLEGGRFAVSMIVGRDTENLTKEEIIKATVETVAENTSDGIVAPLFYILLGGGSLGFFYKAINTMDSMIGYKNETYLHFGKAAAKIDDVLNYIPARISAFMMIITSFMMKMDGKNAIRIYQRDRYKHASPNSAHTEAVSAGALRIQLAGDTYYFGKKYEKEYIGDNIEKITLEKIVEVNQLLYGTSWLTLLTFCVLKMVVML